MCIRDRVWGVEHAFDGEAVFRMFFEGFGADALFDFECFAVAAVRVHCYICVNRHMRYFPAKRFIMRSETVSNTEISAPIMVMRILLVKGIQIMARSIAMP